MSNKTNSKPSIENSTKPKNNKTLIIVIVIVVVLAIVGFIVRMSIATNSVLGMFNSAKASVFKTEVQAIMNDSERQNISDHKSCYDSKSNILINYNNNMDNDYYVRLDAQGRIVELFVQNDMYFINLNNNNGITRSDISALTFNSSSASVDDTGFYGVPSSGKFTNDVPSCN